MEITEYDDSKNEFRIRINLSATGGEFAQCTSTMGIFQLPPEIAIDFSSNGIVDVTDMDELVSQIVSGGLGDLAAGKGLLQFVIRIGSSEGVASP